MSIVKDLLFISLFLIVILTLLIIGNDIGIFTLTTLMVFCMLSTHIKKYMKLKQENIQQREYFIKTLSHDLKVSVLAQIRGLDFLQKTMYQNSPDTELVSEINDSCKYTLDMITMLLNTFRFENGEQILSRESFKFSEVIYQCGKNLARSAEEKEINLLYKIGNNNIYADKRYITKVFETLISTAIINSDRKSEIYILARNRQDKFEFSVSYAGKGLSEEECRRMFSKNPRFSTVGHGIKMHLCKKIIEFHGGEIRVNNNGKNLNSFTFTLPLVKNKSFVKPPLLSTLQPYKL